MSRCSSSLQPPKTKPDKDAAPQASERGNGHVNAAEEGRTPAGAGLQEVCVLDSGGEYAQLIARRTRECGVSSELLPHDVRLDELERRRPRGIVLSGGPASVYAEGAQPLRRELLELGVPVHGICYGMQAMALSLGGRVEKAEVGEFGRTELRVREHGRLSVGLLPVQTCWMSDRVTVFQPPAVFVALASSPASTVAALEPPERGFYGMHFHRELVYTEHGNDILRSFLFDV